MLQQDAKRSKLARNAIWLSVLVCGLIVLAFLLDYYGQIDGHLLGVTPRSTRQWWGIMSMPLVHGSREHLFNNITAMFTCAALLFYFFPQQGVKIFGWLWFVSGFWTWLLAQGGVHVGASALIYGLSAFLFLSGVLRKSRRLWALTAFMICFYGGLVWGIFPHQPGISWEGHLAGLVAGLLFALLYRAAPTVIDLYPELQDKVFTEEEDEDDDTWWHEQLDIMNKSQQRYQIKYRYKPKSDDRQTKE